MILRALLLLLLTLSGAYAAESPPVVSKRATVTLVSDTDAVASGQPYRLGLRFQMAPGWHTYGRNPGDAGVPPELVWTLPAGTTTGEILWPTPQRLPEGPLMTFGYTGEAMLVVPATGPGPVKLHASWLICANICVPEEGDFSLDLPPGTPAASAQAGLFAVAEAMRPRASPFAATISPDGVLAVAGLGGVREAFFMPDEPDRVVPTGVQTLGRAGDGLTLALKTGEAFKPKEALPGVLVVTDAGGTQSALAVTAQPGAVAPVAGSGLGRAILFALLGGLVLNLMPCVFPVLAMKAMAIAKLSGQSRAQARQQAFGYTAGVIGSFVMIGGLVLGLRGLGHDVGWGFQFQSPIFVAAMAWVLFGVGLNLSGVFEVSGRIAGVGQSATLRGGWAGSVASGALAVLVATPCTAPFMSVALAASLTAPPVETMAIFAALGLGLAAPAALLVLAPATARLLPRPGRWMDVLKQALAFPMYAACAWLVWVVSVQAGDAGVLAVAAGLVAIGFAAWVLRFRRIGPVLAVVAVLGAVALLPGLSGGELSGSAPKVEAHGGEAFSAARLASLRSEGKPVFVNMTAAWCVTCLVNERVALAPLRPVFAERGVVTLVGDWTRQDAEISAFLKSRGRDGVPLYLFFPAGNGAGVELSQILTQAEVLRVIGG